MRCRLCGGHAEDFNAGGAVYGECGDCGYIGIEPGLLPTAAEEEARYRLHRNSWEDRAYRSWILGFIDAASPFIAPGGSVLDFGSGPEPVPARLLSERGFRVTLHDPYFAPGDWWRSMMWDAILVHEVAEHLHEPGRDFAALAAILAPGGALCVRTRFPPEGREAFAAWQYRTDVTHVGFFGERSLRLLASRLGLEAVLIEAPDRAVLVQPRTVEKGFIPR